MLTTLTAVALATLVGQAENPDTDAVLTPVQQLRVDLGLPAVAEEEQMPEIVRVAGDEDVMPESVNGYQWRLGNMFIETALPDGYPRPTPPETMEIKHYPSVRRAEVSGENMRGASNRGFMPLFRHISSNDIAMTSPVEMDIEGWSTEGDEQPTRWTMSFLYRTPELRETGTEGDVVIRDTEPVTVISMGTRGDYDRSGMSPALAELEEWLAGQDAWEQAGDPRWFGYNGPMTRRDLRWGEVQIPIQRVEDAGVEDAAEASDDG